MRRNTIQKELVLNAVRYIQRHATAEEVYEYLHTNHPTIGKGTVYRNLNILAEEGEIRKVQVPGGPDRYDHICTKHHHVKCTKCGRLFDINLKELPDLMNCIGGTNGMKFLDYEIMFAGICPACQDEDAEKD